MNYGLTQYAVCFVYFQEGRSVEVPEYDFTKHQKAKEVRKVCSCIPFPCYQLVTVLACKSYHRRPGVPGSNSQVVLSFLVILSSCYGHGGWG